MGGTQRKGRWRVPESSTAAAIMGSVDLDLRAATLTSQVTTINAISIMGAVNVVVPPGVRVETVGLPVMGGLDDQVDDDLLDSAPLVRIRFLALMGGVGVYTKAPKQRPELDS